MISEFSESNGAKDAGRTVSIILIDDPEFRESLRRIIAQLARAGESPEDLMQELLLHICRIQSALPDKTWKWYLRSCWYFLQSYLRRERRRAYFEQPLPPPPSPTDYDSSDEFENEMEMGSDDSFHSIVGADDLIALLSARLKTERGLIVLLDFAEGCRVRDITQDRHFKQQTVTNIRLRLSSMLIQLGFQPPGGKHPRNRN